MLVSVITVCYNSADTVRQTIESVLSQSYQHIEYIVIDGGSTDGTIDILKEYGARLVYTSEPDGGIYDAMNKGIRKASGDVVGILNSDDVYFNHDVIRKVACTIEKQKVDSVYGNLLMSKSNDSSRYIRTWVPGQKKSFVWGWHPPHPTVFIKKACYERLGMYKTTFNVSADFELMLRFFEVNRMSSSYINEPLVKMRLGGESTGSLKKILIGNLNIKKAFNENKIRYLWIYPVIRICEKLFQFVRK